MIKPDLKRYLANLEAELNSAALYQALADLEKDRNLADIYGKLAAAERKHAQAWERLARKAGAELPATSSNGEVRPGFRPSLRTRIFIRLAGTFGVGFILPALARLERADVGKYSGQPEAQGMSREEQSHMKLLSEITRASSSHGMQGDDLARLEGRHRMSGGNALRAAVLGANDGLVSNLSLVMGVAGAQVSGHGILLAGWAGLSAGACSMALGEWLSVQSSRESFERQIDLERQEIEATPKEEAEELALIYQARGFRESEARSMADRVLSQEEVAVDTMAREELGIDPDKLGGSAWVAAGASFLLFALGAAVPLLPFALLSGKPAVAGALAASTVALFMLGAAVTLFTGRSVWISGIRQVGFGMAAAGITFGFGRLVGGMLGG